MAIINVDDAYILNETGAEVDKVTGLFTKNENATPGEKQMARLNIAAGGSNDNLLDNAYFVGGGSQLGDGVFPINQRGQTVYTSDGPGIDRWKQFAATVTLASDGVTVTPSAYSNNFLQLMNPAKWDALVGETVTLSIDVLAITGTIIFAGYNTGIGTITSTGIAVFTFTMPSGIADGNKFFGLAGQSGSSIKFGRWKLEKGTVSTLPNDPPPDFGEKLRKCQRYLRYVPFTRSLFYLEKEYSIAIKTLEGIQMAGTPTAALVQAGPVIQLSNPPAYATTTGVSVIANYYSTPTVQIGLSAALEGVGEVTETVILLSCEL